MLVPHSWGIVSSSLRQMEIHLHRESEDPPNAMDRTRASLPRSIQSMLSTVPVGRSRGARTRPFTPTGVPLKTIAEERLWNKRPDGIAIKMPKEGKQGEFVILEFKRMSDVTDNYLTLAKDKAEGSDKSKVSFPLSFPSSPLVTMLPILVSFL